MDTIYNRDGCFYRALDDEPVFVLLARDPCTPEAIRWWVTLRQALIGQGQKPLEDHGMLADALATATAAHIWRNDSTDPTNGFDAGEHARWRVEEVPERRLVARDAVEAEEARHADTIREMQAHIDSLEKPAARPTGSVQLPYEAWVRWKDAAMRIGNRFLLGVHAGRLYFSEYAAVKNEAPEWSNLYLLQKSLQAEMLYEAYYAWTKRDRAAETIEAIGDATGTVFDGKVMRKGHDDSDTIDVTDTPDMPPHRFTMFTKSEGWAYGRGLEISPAHIPAMLDRMEKDGWMLHCVLGGVTADKVGMIFQRTVSLTFNETGSDALRLPCGGEGEPPCGPAGMGRGLEP